MKNYYVYILASQRNGTLYIGVTSHLIRRVWQHKSGEVPGFTSEYKVHQLVYYEMHDDILMALKREKNLKAWKRAWKLGLIDHNNPDWKDLYFTLV
ncbi:MAG: GIY-YIG nuclease family protein [Gammaproteobacteria bacterium]|nr:GIY-YIG nuclease family protein [Gammaproteobacteria bacterium]